MGRGLSPLQRYIVAKAATVDRLYYHDILEDYYGWKSHMKRFHRRERYMPGEQKFWPAEIGEQRYHATMVTLSRSTARLAQRGLVTCLQGTIANWSGVEITPAGRRLAEAWGPGAASQPSEQEGRQANG
jgi:hypothetical protein